MTAARAGDPCAAPPAGGTSRRSSSLVDRGERGPRHGAALDHLGGCGRCREREVTELALTVAALRRAGRELPRRARPAPIPHGRPLPAARAARLGVARCSWAASSRARRIAALLVAPQVGFGAAGASDALEPHRPRTGSPLAVGGAAHSPRSPDTAPWPRHRDDRAATLSRRPDSGRGRRCPRPTPPPRGLDPDLTRSGTSGPARHVGDLTPVSAVSDPRPSAARWPLNVRACANPELRFTARPARDGGGDGGHRPAREQSP